MRNSRLIVVALGLVVLCVSFTEAAKWSSAYIRQLPDSAFAVVELRPNGITVRRLPHHDARGDLDLPHLCNALARMGQVKWIDPANAIVARLHLKEHLAQVGTSTCRPTRQTEF
jgi:hypothetical protein